MIRLSVVPDGCNAIPSRIIVKGKYDSTGAYERRKARWIILGFYAKFDLEYHNTYAPTAMLPTARLLFAIAAKHALRVSHADIPQASVQAPIDVRSGLNPPRASASTVMYWQNSAANIQEAELLCD